MSSGVQKPTIKIPGETKPKTTGRVIQQPSQNTANVQSISGVNDSTTTPPLSADDTPPRKIRHVRKTMQAIPLEWWTVRVMCVIGIVGSVFAAFRKEDYVASVLGIIGGAFLVSWTEDTINKKQKLNLPEHRAINKSESA